MGDKVGWKKRLQAGWNRMLGAGKRGLAGLRRNVFVTASWLVLLLLIPALILALFAAAPKAGLITALVVLLLIAALCAQYGNDLRARIKKLGPLELFEEEVPGLLDTLERIDRRIKESGEAASGALSPEEAHTYREADFYASLLELSNLEPEKPKQRKVYYRLLFYTGVSAVRQNDWQRAIARLERLEELSAGKYEPATVYYNLGLAYLYRGIQAGTDGEPFFRKAKAAFRRVVEEDHTEYLALFYLAWVQVELGDYGEAVRSNGQALLVRPQFAPARYNRVVALVKLRQFQQAYVRLRKMKPHHEEASRVFEHALEDEELQPLLMHPKLGLEVRRFLEGKGAGA